MCGVLGKPELVYAADVNVDAPLELRQEVHAIWAEHQSEDYVSSARRHHASFLLVKDEVLIADNVTNVVNEARC
jgi:hypothetical protein